MIEKFVAGWEGFAVSEVVRGLNAKQDECFFWATHQEAELDLLVVRDNQRLGFEFKRSSAPKRTRSMAIPLKDLRLDELVVVHAGEHEFEMGERLRAVPMSNFMTQV